MGLADVCHYVQIASSIGTRITGSSLEAASNFAAVAIANTGRSPMLQRSRSRNARSCVCAIEHGAVPRGGNEICTFTQTGFGIGKIRGISPMIGAYVAHT